MSAGDMPDELDELDESASEDLRNMYDTVQTYRSGSTSTVDMIPKLIEGLLWTLTLAALGVFFVGMFYTGRDGVLTGTEWLVIGVGGLLVFGSMAYAFRMVMP